MTDDPHERTAVGLGWRLLAAATALAMVLVAVVVQLTQGVVIPPLVVLPVVFAVGLVLLAVRPRAGVITVGGAALVMVLANIPFVVDDLPHPESFWSFLPATIGVVGGLVGAALLFGGVRRAADGPAAVVGVVAGVAVIALIAVAAVSSGGYGDDRRQEGDFGMFAQDIEFAPDTIDTTAGEVGVYIGNDDLVRHNFSISDLDVDEELPSKAFVRVAFAAEPGTYEFFCDIPGHEDMTGTLTVR